MRISCLSFARIHNRYGELALLLNKGRLKHNKLRILTPIGGGLEVKDAGRKFLLGRGAEFEKGDDLRFWIPDAQMEAVKDWFELRRNRETSVLRELNEELVDETHLLEPTHLRGATEQFAGFATHDDLTKRVGVRENSTRYLIEVFDVFLPAPALRLLDRASQTDRDRRWMHFVSQEEIRLCQSRERVLIGGICQTIIR